MCILCFDVTEPLAVCNPYLNLFEATPQLEASSHFLLHGLKLQGNSHQRLTEYKCDICPLFWEWILFIDCIHSYEYITIHICWQNAWKWPCNHGQNCEINLCLHLTRIVLGFVCVGVACVLRTQWTFRDHKVQVHTFCSWVCCVKYILWLTTTINQSLPIWSVWGV